MEAEKQKSGPHKAIHTKALKIQQMCYKYGPEMYNFHLKLSLLQVILGVSDIHLRLCKPKEQIH